jgi:hypothetical protein
MMTPKKQELSGSCNDAQSGSNFLVGLLLEK